ncbi:hypothetical protein [Saccharomonospora halophila]|uniref:hypothetical protein n=1 Tax=Saccharomonospora halophila TaxID=129922 RepID=UPI0003828B01|nr:hypothetical protein [Saccharomonospora halophila]
MTARYWIELGCHVETGTGDLEHHFLSVMDALLDEPGAVDPDVCAELTTGDIRVSLGVDAQTDAGALEQALLITRSAIHKAGGFTPEWEKTAESKFFVADGFDARVRPAPLGSR